jgi:hypothetical protein
LTSHTLACIVLLLLLCCPSRLTSLLPPAGLVVARALRTIDRSEDLGLRMMKQPAHKQIDYYYSNLLGEDWKEQIEQVRRHNTLPGMLCFLVSCRMTVIVYETISSCLAWLALKLACCRALHIPNPSCRLFRLC